MPDRKVNAVIYEIANTATSRGLGTQEEVTNFQVKMRIVDRGVPLRPGMSMVADIETETRTNVLAVPIQSVTTRAPKKPEGEAMAQNDEPQGEIVMPVSGGRAREQMKPAEIVFVVENGQVKTKTVKRGISDATHVEILEGVDEGLQVVSGSYKAINRELEDGAKVRVEEDKKKQGRAPEATT
jgi:HlyD family secretion protein